MSLLVEELSQLPDGEQKLVALAVLLDGVDAEWYLSFSPANARKLSELSRKFTSIPLDLRTQISATLLREPISEIDLESK